MLPDFIIIGAMKCGTTSLYHYLNMHPQIGMSQIKETNFFIKERNYERGIEWYKLLFKGDYKIYGEASPNYTKAHLFEKVPQRIHDLLPDVKLIYIVRDPIERIISHYAHKYGNGKESGNMNKVFWDQEKFNHYVLSSKYFWQLQHYLEFFSKDQILIISSNKLRTHRKSALKEILEFLKVNNVLDEEVLQAKYGVTGNKTRTGRISRGLLNNFIIDSLKKNVPNDFKRRIKKVFLPPLKKPSQISPVLKNRLEESLKSDVEALRSFTGQRFEGWSV